MDSRKMGNFTNKVIVAFLVGIVLFVVCPHHAFGQTQTWATSGTDAKVDVSNGTPTALSPPTNSGLDTIANNHALRFANAGHSLTITDGGEDNAVAPDGVTAIGSITTVNRGGGTLIFDLQNPSTTLVVGDIGTTTNRVTTVEVRNNRGGLTSGNVFAGTLINNGSLTINGDGAVGTLSGSGSIRSTDNLTVNQGTFGGNITTDSGNFTADLTGNLSIAGTLDVGGDAKFTGNGRADLGQVNVTGDTTIEKDTTVALDIGKSTFGSKEITGNGTLEVYGDNATASVGAIKFTGGNFKNISIFTDWQWNGSDITYQKPLDQAHLSDGYLAAFTMHHRYTAWNMVRDRLVSGNGNGKDLWFNYIGRNNTYHSSFNNRDWNTFVQGGQIGVDLLKTPRFQSGLLFGYEGGKSRNESDQLKATDFYFGLYGAHIFRCGVDARIVFAQGWQDYDLDRTGNRSVLYTSSFNGWTSEANFELGKRIGVGGWSLRPVLAADVYSNNLKGTQEAGSGNEKIRYDKTNLTQVFLRTGTDFRHRTKDYTFNSGIYYAHDVHGAELRTIVSDENMNSAPLVGTKMGKSLLMFNLGCEGELSSNLFLFGGYTGEYVMDSAKDSLHSIASVGFFGKW